MSYFDEKRFRARAPVGKRSVTGFVDGTDSRGRRTGGYGTFEIEDYQQTPEQIELAQLRKLNGFSLRECATLLGLSPIEASSVEHGKIEPLDPAEYTRWLETLTNAARRREAKA